MAHTRSNLSKPLQASHILLTCGTGGVGKTTIAAALGMAAAHLGRRTLVLTIDPAKRLANALGLDEMKHEVRKIWDDPSHGSLDCMMLDVKRTFDRVIERYAPDTKAAETIIKNPLYQQLSTMIAGSQEYMAMEQLYDVVIEQDYDLIILDTPPSQHALDFFQAPERMIRALSDSMLRLFVKPSMMAGKLGARLLSRGADTMLRLFGNITGVEILQEISDFLMSTVGLFGGFRQRAEAVQTMLHQTTTGIVLVTTPQEDLVRDARRFIREATQNQMRLAAVILNRTMPVFEPIKQAASALDTAPAALRQLLATHLTICQAHHTEEHRMAEDLTDLAPQRTPALCLAQRDHEINNLEDIQQLATEILG